MIKIGINNYAETASATTEESGYSVDNVLLPDGLAWRATGATATLIVSFDEPKFCNLVSVHGITAQDVKITARKIGSEKFSKEYSSTELSGIDYLSLGLGGEDVIDDVVIELQHFEQQKVEVGYVFVGYGVSYDVESLQIFDESSDTVTVTLGNLANSTEGYLFQRANFTSTKTPVEELKDNTRQILKSGAYAPRPFYITCEDQFRDTCFLSVMNGTNVGYSFVDSSVDDEEDTLIAKDTTESFFIDTGEGKILGIGSAGVNQRKAQVTLGVTEVFGGLQAS